MAKPTGFAPEWPPAARAWMWVLLLLLAYTSSFVDRQILSLMVDPIKRDLVIGDTGFGLLHGLSFAIFYTTLGIPIGNLVDVTSRRMIIFFGVTTWSVMTALCGTASQYYQLFLARIGVGVGEAALSPAAYSLISDCFRPEKLGRALSVYFMGVACGAGLALILGGWVISLISSSGPISLPVFGQLASWQAVFICVALPGFPIAALFLLLREPVRHGQAAATDRSWSAVLNFISGHSRFLMPFLTAVACFSTIATATLSWTPAYFMRVHQFSATQIGYAFGIVTIVSMASGLLFGAWLAERLAKHGHVDAPIRAGCILIACGVPLGSAAMLASDPQTSLALIGMLLFCNAAPGGICATVLQLLTPNRMRGRMSAIYLFSINVVSVIAGPLLPALLTDYYFASPQRIGQSLAVTTTMLGILGAIAFFIAGKHFARLRPLQQESTS